MSITLRKEAKKEGEWSRIRKSKSRVKRYYHEMGLRDPWIDLGKSARRNQKNTAKGEDTLCD